MLKNKKLIILGSAMLAVPLIATVSCSTSWTSWSVDEDQEQTNVEYNPQYALPNLWQVRDISELRNAAWNDQTKTIDLSQVRNQYELMDLVINVLGLSSNAPIDTYYTVANYPLMKMYLEGITKNINLNIKFNTTTQIRWDVSKIIDDAIKGIDDYLANPDPSNKAYDVEKNGLNSAGQPNDFNQVATVGAPLTNNPVVTALLAEDNAFALSLSKLVNLPETTFNSFSSLLTQIDHLLSSMLISTQFNEWARVKGLDFTVSPNSGMTGVYSNSYAYMRNNHFKGIFMQRALK